MKTQPSLSVQAFTSGGAAIGGTHSTDKTSHTDDERIKDITVLPPPEHLIRFFPILGTPVEDLISITRKKISNIMRFEYLKQTLKIRA